MSIKDQCLILKENGILTNTESKAKANFVKLMEGTEEEQEIGCYSLGRVDANCLVSDKVSKDSFIHQIAERDGDDSMLKATDYPEGSSDRNNYDYQYIMCYDTDSCDEKDFNPENGLSADRYHTCIHKETCQALSDMDDECTDAVLAKYRIRGKCAKLKEFHALNNERPAKKKYGFDQLPQIPASCAKLDLQDKCEALKDAAILTKTDQKAKAMFYQLMEGDEKSQALGCYSLGRVEANCALDSTKTPTLIDQIAKRDKDYPKLKATDYDEYTSDRENYGLQYLMCYNKDSCDDEDFKPEDGLDASRYHTCIHEESCQALPDMENECQSSEALKMARLRGKCAKFQEFHKINDGLFLEKYAVPEQLPNIPMVCRALENKDEASKEPHAPKLTISEPEEFAASKETIASVLLLFTLFGINQIFF